MARKKIDQKDDRKTRIFLSYSRKDLAFTELLKSELEKAGYQPSLDKTDIAPGEAWQDRLGKLIQDADAVVFCLSPHSAASTICGWEVNQAAKLGKRIIPVVADAVDTSGLPDALTKLNFIFFVDTSFEEAFAKLRSALDTNLAWIRLHTRLSELALEWHARNNSSSQLLFGRSLRDAEYWSTTAPSEEILPTPLQLKFIAASRSASSSRLRWGLIAACAISAVSLALFGWGLVNQIEADEQRIKAEQNANAAIEATETISVDLVNNLNSLSGVRPDAIQSVLETTSTMQNNLIERGVTAVSLKAALVTTYLQLALSHKIQGNSEKAIEIGRKATKQADDVKTIIDNMENKTAEDLRLQNVNLSNRAASYETLGDIQKEMSEDYVSAKASYQTQIESAQLVSDDYAGKNAKAVHVAMGQTNLGDAQLQLNETTNALATATLANDTLKNILHENGEKLDQCKYPISKTADAQARKDFLSNEVSTLDLMGRILNHQKDYVAGEKYLCEALQEAKEISDANPKDLQVKRIVNQQYKSLANNLQLQGGPQNTRAFMLFQSYEKSAKTLADENPTNAIILDDYSNAIITRVNNMISNIPREFLIKELKAYADLRLQLATLSPTNPVVLEKVVVTYEMLHENNISLEDSDSEKLKIFFNEMEKRYSALNGSGDARIELAKNVMAALPAQ